jgi:hypothetical protein
MTTRMIATTTVNLCVFFVTILIPSDLPDTLPVHTNSCHQPNHAKIMKHMPNMSGAFDLTSILPACEAVYSAA